MKLRRSSAEGEIVDEELSKLLKFTIAFHLSSFICLSLQATIIQFQSSVAELDTSQVQVMSACSVLRETEWYISSATV
ncbi:unnamed protein product [Anisakis simplex]|uniref:Ovule protein n=1 Tax=Anisakis simplex TaxID=6269 RepID=A0A0M3JTI0_ANISI|nr:unnamed protein product [Anisakis simplex]